MRFRRGNVSRNPISSLARSSAILRPSLDRKSHYCVSACQVFRRGCFSWKSSSATMSEDMNPPGTGDTPSAAWTTTSSTTMFGVGALCRAFLLGGSYPELHGLESFMKLLDSRRDVSQRTKGLLTGTVVFQSLRCLRCANTIPSQCRIILACTYVRCFQR